MWDVGESDSSPLFVGCTLLGPAGYLEPPSVAGPFWRSGALEPPGIVGLRSPGPLGLA